MFTNKWIAAGLILLLAAVGGFYLQMHWHPGHDAGAPRITAAQKRETRQQTVATLAPSPIVGSSILVGDDTQDPDGYPTRHVDRAFVRSLLWRENYVELTQYFELFQAEFEDDYRKEYWLPEAADSFESAEKELTSMLDAWAAATPASFAPYLARGTHLVAVAQARRGGAWINETHEDDLTAMGVALDRAQADLDRAVAIQPRLVAAMRKKIVALVLRGDDTALRQTIDQAVAVCPLCFQVRVAYMIAIRPRWGGSYDLMAAFARESHRSSNPKMRFLAGYVDFDKADLLRREKDYQRALTTIERACALGDHWQFLLERAKTKESLDDLQGAAADLDRAAAIRPGHPDILVKRAYLRYRLRQWEAAGSDLLSALRVNPTDSTARYILDTVVAGLIYEGWQHHTAERKQDALRVYDLAAELAPTNREVQTRRAVIVAGPTLATPDAIAELQRKARAAPNDFRAHQELAYALARLRRFDEGLQLWNDYLTHNPKDGQAYLDRSGTYFHLGRHKDAWTDARTACSLGVSEGCVRAKQVEPALGK